MDARPARRDGGDVLAMTCVIGLIENGAVYLGGDSAGAETGGWALDVRADEKVFKNGPYVMGFTTSFRMGDLLRYSLKPPAPEGHRDLRGFMATEFVNAVRTALKEGGFATKDKEVESAGQFLVGVSGRLFTIHGDYQVAESCVPYAAVGCGAQVALGAMYVSKNRDPRRRIRIALAAAERFSAGVRGPFRVIR